MKNVLITGAAAGIGRSLVSAFLAAGWRVGAYDIDINALGELRQKHSDAALVIGYLDVRELNLWEKSLDSFCGNDALDLLVNNAGILQGGKFTDISLVAQLETIDINVKGTLCGCYVAFPYLRRSAQPQVINMASASAIYGQAELATYSASKFAVRGLSEALDIEWRPFGIRVQTVWPLFVKTKMTQGLDIGTTRALGVRLTPDEVATRVVSIVTRRLPPRMSIHRSVGLSTMASMLAASITPSWVLRRVNVHLARTGSK